MLVRKRFFSIFSEALDSHETGLRSPPEVAKAIHLHTAALLAAPPNPRHTLFHVKQD